VNGDRRFPAGCLNEAEDRSGAFVEPVLEVINPVLTLHLQVALVGASDRFRGEAFDLVVVVHVQRHRDTSLLIS
jgi:hypothetical protein